MLINTLKGFVGVIPRTNLTFINYHQKKIRNITEAIKSYSKEYQAGLSCRTQQSRVFGVDMSYLRGVCGVIGWEGESSERVYERCNMGPCAKGGEVWWSGMGEKK